MNTILKRIIQEKERELINHKQLVPVHLMERSVYFNTKVVSMVKYLSDESRSGIIAEIKRKAPSYGPLGLKIKVEDLSISYMQNGAAALSLLTDKTFFGGSNQDLITARAFNFCPILRKDFIIDEYQVIETKSIGADCLLLIAACLSPQRCKALASLAKSIGLEVLLEVRNEEEIHSHYSDDIDLLGVNNRDLDDFSVDISRSEYLASFIPEGVIAVSDSGLREAEDLFRLKGFGYKGFLIGTHFMQQADPGKGVRTLVRGTKNIRV